MNRELIKKFSDIRKRSTHFCTNMYSYQFKDILDLKESKDTITILVQDRDVKRIYFATCDLENMAKFIKEWPSGSGIDYLSRNEEELELESELKNVGFEKYATYLKAENNQISNTLLGLDENKYEYEFCESCVSEINIRDASKIIETLYSVFNPLTSHIEDRNEICERIMRGNIVVHKEFGEIVTLLTFNPKPKKLYMEHMINKSDSKYMHLLYYYVLKKEMEKGITSVDTWIREGNYRAFNFVKRYGLMPNGLKNFVFCKI